MYVRTYVLYGLEGYRQRSMPAVNKIDIEGDAGSWWRACPMDIKSVDLFARNRQSLVTRLLTG